MPFDSTGNLNTNRKVETWTVTEINGVDHNYYVPDFAPFHAHGVVIWNALTGQPLEKGTDYEFTLLFEKAKDAIGSDIYSGIYFTDPSRAGTYKVSLASIGSTFVNAENELIKGGLKALDDLLNITWDELVPADQTFPPTAHTQPYTDVQAVGEMMARIVEVTEAIKSGSRDIKMTDITDLNETYINPLMSRLSDIANAINNKAVASSTYHEYVSTGNNPVALGTFPADTWFDIPLQISPDFIGTYEIGFQLQIQPLDGVAFSYITRFLVNGQLNPKSYDNGAIIQIPADAVITLSAKLVGRGGPVVIATTESSSFISAKRLSI